MQQMDKVPAREANRPIQVPRQPLLPWEPVDFNAARRIERTNPSGDVFI
jgi:hypothetical protein